MAGHPSFFPPLPGVTNTADQHRHRRTVTDTATIPRAPAGLKAAGKAVWKAIVAVYSFEDAPEKLIILESAARVGDVAARLQAIVDNADDLRTLGSQRQLVQIPEVAELRQYRALLATLLRAVNCPGDDDVLTRSELGKLGAAARWSR
jgi:hypothetical protein